jgi:predicted ATPase
MLAMVLLDRIRRLNRAERVVLMRAAFIGRRFRLALLAAVLALDEGRVRAALDAACELQLLVSENAPGNWYSFRHALTRDIAYEEFIATRVRPIHRRIGRALEAELEEGRVSLEDLAYHAWAAADSARCVRYNELAGDRAAAAFAAHDAARFYGRARAFVALNSHDYRRLSEKLETLHSEGAQAPGAGPDGRQSSLQRDPATRSLPPVRWTPG